jgi:hypothetical protein
MITFLEHSDHTYVGRTKVNARADATIAIAVDFYSAGEKLTKTSVESQGKKYLNVDISACLEITEEVVAYLARGLNSSLKGNLLDSDISLNIAGNGIYTMKNKYSQEELDVFVYQLLKRVLESPLLKVKIKKVRTGGQTGIDEAGAKAGELLGIETLVLAPKGWKFRNEEGRDILDEILFKSRF